MVNCFIADVSCLRQHPLPLNSIKRLKLKPLLRDWLVNEYNGKLVETGKDNCQIVFDGWIICDFTPFLTVFQSYQDVAEPVIEPRTSELRVKCPTGCATWPGSFLSGGGRVVRRCWVNFQCRGVLLIWIIEGQGPIALAVGAGGGYLDIFSLVYLFSFLSLSLRDGPI